MKHSSLIYALCSLLASVPALAQTPWSDFEAKDALTLEKELVINSALHFKKGSSFIVHSTETLDPVPVMVFTLQFTGCTSDFPQEPLELILLDEIYGFEWKKNCRANLYVEFKDLGKKSYFQKSKQ